MASFGNSKKASGRTYHTKQRFGTRTFASRADAEAFLAAAPITANQQSIGASGLQDWQVANARVVVRAYADGTLYFEARWPLTISISSIEVLEGDRVHHDKWGWGTVTHFPTTGPNAMMVEFDDGEQRKVLDTDTD